MTKLFNNIISLWENISGKAARERAEFEFELRVEEWSREEIARMHEMTYEEMELKERLMEKARAEREAYELAWIEEAEREAEEAERERKLAIAYDKLKKRCEARKAAFLAA